LEGAQLLKGKHAVVFGAAGSIGSGVAREFAAQGAELFLVGRSHPGLEELAEEITDGGGQAHVAVIDAEDATAVDAYIERISREAGSVDVVCNVVGPRAKDYGNGKPAPSSTNVRRVVRVTLRRPRPGGCARQDRYAINVTRTSAE
jgi:NAD(P)-dependent dehydrogenase (short-subunit alcohol dehydrogenase family)